MKKIYADVQSLVKDKKILKVSDIPVWPIDEKKFKGFYNEVLFNYESLVSSQNKIIKDLALSDFRFLMDLINYIHYLSAYTIAKKTFKPINFKKVINAQEKKLWINSYKIKKKSENYSFLKIKKFLKNYLYSNKNKKKVLVFGSKTENLEQFIYKNKEKPIFDYYKLFFSDNKSSFIQEKINIKNIDFFFKKIEKATKKNFGISVDLTQIKLNWKKKFFYLMEDYLQVINSKYIKNFKKIYFTDDMQTNHRLMSSAAQSLGIETYRLDHGNNFYFKENRLNKFFISSYRYHICENKNSLRSLNKVIKVNKNLLKSSKIIIQNILLKKKIKKKMSKNIKTVMLLGFPMTTNRYMGPEDLFWNNELILELQILKVLKKNGYKVLYKIHPSITGWEHVLNKYVDEIIYEKFEDCWNKADLFIFTNIGSTTFAYSLSTNIPVILFDNKNNTNWNKGVLKYIKKRCHLIDYKRNNLTQKFNTKKLLYKVKNIKRVRNNMILDNFLEF